MDDRIGRLFPAGGPVPADLVIGRTGDIEEIVRRSREAIHTMLTGPRRIGKTTVCAAVCEQLRQGGTVVADIEVPERAGLAERFTQAALELVPEALEKLIEFGEGRPYPTMTAARYAALGARKLGSATVEAFDAQMAIDEARRHLEEDDHA